MRFARQPTTSGDWSLMQQRTIASVHSPLTITLILLLLVLVLVLVLVLDLDSFMAPIRAKSGVFAPHEPPVSGRARRPAEPFHANLTSLRI